MSDVRYVPISSIEAATKLTPARIYRLAFDHLWRRRRVNGRTHYLWADVCDTLNKSPNLT